MRSIRFTLAITLALLVTSSCSSGPQGARVSGSPSSKTTRTFVLGGEPMTPCPGAAPAVCGRLTVPEDRGDPNGRQIELSVQIFPAQDPNPAADPVFFVAGGPGDASTDTWSSAPNAFPEVHAHRDIVLVDQRGTGDSNPLWLPESPDVSGMSRKQAIATFQAWLDDYLAGLDAEPQMYGSSQAADDLDDVRAALGYDRIDLYGGSYGATLIQYYLRQHGNHGRAAVLDGGTLLDVPVLDLIPRNSQRALDSVLERCAADTACAKAFPDPAGELSTAMARLADHPVRTDVLDPWAGAPIVVDDDALASQIHTLLVTSQAAQIPLTIHEAATGDIDAVAERIASSIPDPATDAQQELMYWTIICSESWARSDPATIAQVGAGSYSLAQYLAGAQETATSCGIAPKASLLPGDDQPVRSGVPVLLLNGAEDPQDPPSNVADASTELPNSLEVSPAGLGHVVGYMGCLPNVVAAFLEAGSVEGLDTSCVAGMSPAPFVLP